MLANTLLTVTELRSSVKLILFCINTYEIHLNIDSEILVDTFYLTSFVIEQVLTTSIN